MKFLAFSDVHQDLEAIRKLIERADEVDFLVCAGDISTFGTGLERSCAELAKANKEIFIIPGNSERPEILLEICKKYNFKFIHGKSERIGNYNFVGIGGSLPTPFFTPYEISESEFKRLLSSFLNLNKIVLVTHNPPYKTKLDHLLGMHTGSKSIRDFIESADVEICICGHIHEHAGEEDFVKKTKVINAGKKGVVIEL
ncbi:MAG: metallophosphoesterase [Candidatus Parvarchaeota archaeon]|nr:metallophosphoesterase [Candidatus Jingweiarchaeum tengchongense]MCW1298379.1 metallophosphoesterase [Candidatus Jingweiarchaeum tengchongense]MCW1300319.1 metallophosphoesterase [Candidatus Jingweiarchaeum tengchongense]MCW1304884.1 metallophosphoesterase [Candidatus Jingweiarchaeum tengchongense]MCW1305815.1 metallophosphoesterase [Candidatus Jingweiarchaeum tengchongense]